MEESVTGVATLFAMIFIIGTFKTPISGYYKFNNSYYYNMVNAWYKYDDNSKKWDKVTIPFMLPAPSSYFIGEYANNDTPKFLYEYNGVRFRSD